MKLLNSRPIPCLLILMAFVLTLSNCGKDNWRERKLHREMTVLAQLALEFQSSKQEFRTTDKEFWDFLSSEVDKRDAELLKFDNWGEAYRLIASEDPDGSKTITVRSMGSSPKKDDDLELSIKVGADGRVVRISDNFFQDTKDSQ